MSAHIPWVIGGSLVRVFYVVAGVYSPRAKGHLNTEICLDLLTQDIAEGRECGYAIYNHAILIYVNMCDVNGRATPDLHV